MIISFITVKSIIDGCYIVLISNCTYVQPVSLLYIFIQMLTQFVLQVTLPGNFSIKYLNISSKLYRSPNTCLICFHFLDILY